MAEAYEAKTAEKYPSKKDMDWHEKTESVAEQSYEKWMGGSPANSLNAQAKWSRGK